jgi:hypothetical protein
MTGAATVSFAALLPAPAEGGASPLMKETP